MSAPASRPLITVVFLLYNAADMVEELVRAVQAQRHPRFARQEEWLEVLFMDDRSRDATLERLERALHRIGDPAHYRVIAASENLGLSRTLNKAFGLARAPYGLTCHCDVLFGRDDYVSAMAALLDAHPDAAAITGQPLVPPAQEGKPLPLAERFNVIANLMDIFPREDEGDLVPVGFAESRCDAFRIAALASVGFHDTTLRLAGEDQVLAARLRAKGYEVYQAPRLTYYLSVSDEQNTLRKLARHQMLYGRAHPYILLRTPKSGAGVVGARAGSNRRARAILRGSQMAAVAVYAWTIAAIVAGFAWWTWAGPLGALFLAKALIFGRHLRAVPLGLGELVAFFALQPALDVAYTAGFAQGLWLLARSSKDKPIS